MSTVDVHRFGSTYEGLKRGLARRKRARRARFGSTYEGLKPGAPRCASASHGRFGSTYEGLKRERGSSRSAAQ